MGKYDLNKVDKNLSRFCFHLGEFGPVETKKDTKKDESEEKSRNDFEFLSYGK
jgi:hypothetical protein